MDVMDLRRGLLMQMASGTTFPNNVEVKTITLDSETLISGNVEIPNPFGRCDMKHIIGITFSDSLVNYDLVAFYVNPYYGISDNSYNRKMQIQSGQITTTNNYAIVSMTNEKITLRNSGSYKFVAGTYYLIAW